MEKWFAIVTVALLVWNLREAAVIRRQREIIRRRQPAPRSHVRVLP